MYNRAAGPGTPGDEHRGPVRLAILVAALIVIAILFRVPYFNGVPGGWLWPYDIAKQWTWSHLVFVALALAFVFIGARWVARGGRKLATVTVVLMASLWLNSYMIVGPGVKLLGPYFVHRLWPGYIQQVTQVKTTREFLSQYHQWQPHATPFAKTHPPGTHLLFRALADACGHVPGGPEHLATTLKSWGLAKQQGLSDRLWLTVTLWAYLTPLIVLSAALPIWIAARRLYPPDTARLAVVLFVLAPAPIFFITKIVPVMMLVAAWSLVFAIRPGRGSKFFAGLLAGAATQFSYGLLAWTILLVMFMGIRWLQDGRLSLRRQHLLPRSMDLAAFTAGHLVLWAPFLLCPYFSVINAYSESMRLHEILTGMRPRGLHFFINLVEFAMFQNPVLMVLFIPTAGISLKNLALGDYSGVDSLAPGVAIVITLLEISLKTSGETGRIWMFLTPAVILPTAQRLNTLPQRQRLIVLCAALAAMLMIVLQLYSV